MSFQMEWNSEIFGTVQNTSALKDQRTSWIWIYFFALYFHEFMLRELNKNGKKLSAVVYSEHSK